MYVLGVIDAPIFPFYNRLKNTGLHARRQKTRCAAFKGGNSMKLTNAGTACCTIVLGNNATWLETHTARELRDYIQKISGAVLIIAPESAAGSIPGAKILIGRRETNTLVCAFDEEYRILPETSDTENDCIAFAVREDTLVISGSNDRSVHYSACHLLETQFGVGFYFDGDYIPDSPDLELETLTVVERSAFRFRHTVGQWVYNFGAFLNVEERKRELDMYAHNKINSYRFYSWNSYVRKRTFQKMGVETEPITPEDVRRMEIQREVAEYARSLGIETMVQMMIQETPPGFRKVYPNARYFGCEWVKDDNAEPDVVACLYPDDPVYKKLVRTFVETWVETYGPSRHFSSCPPSEHHISTGVEDFIQSNIDFARYTYEAVQEAVPDARFFFDGWGVRANTPPHIWTMPGVMERFVDALPEEVYFLDLWPNRKETDSTFREPMYRDENYCPLRRARYVLEPINEFGGDDHMHGDFARHIEAAKEMTDPAVVEHGEGFGNCTELCGVSLHFFDLIFKLAWDPAKVTLDGFLDETARNRYGEKAAAAGARALRALQQAVYSDRDSSHARYQKRCYLVRPQRRQVPVEESLQVTALLNEYMQQMSALPNEEKHRFIGRDMFDVMRQFITEYFNMHLRRLFDAYLRRNTENGARAAFEGHAALLERLLTELEWMTREDEESYVETMVRRYTGRPCDPDVSGADCTPTDFRVWMRDLGTTFAKTIPNLIDYPSRDYHELIACYYHPRVTACIDCLRSVWDRDISPSEVDEMLEARYREVETRWTDVGYEVTDACCAAHLPLWKAAENAWRALRTLPLDAGLQGGDDAAVREVIDVFASFSEQSAHKAPRSWVSENPFDHKE